MLQYYTCPFVQYNDPRMYAPQVPQQFMPQYLQQAPMNQAPMIPGFGMMPAQEMPQMMNGSSNMPGMGMGMGMDTGMGMDMGMGMDTGMDTGMGMDMDMDMEDMMDMGPATARPDDPPPILSNNPPTTSITLFKELTGYANYGNPSGNADILYTGNRGTWTFQLPASIVSGPGNLSGQILLRAVLDDHQNVPTNMYSATITVNNQTVHTGRLPLEHGRPVGTRFTNWQTLTFNVNNLRRNNRIVVVNTSTTGVNDWIAFDWMELRVNPIR